MKTFKVVFSILFYFPPICDVSHPLDIFIFNKKCVNFNDCIFGFVYTKYVSIWYFIQKMLTNASI